MSSQESAQRVPQVVNEIVDEATRVSKDHLNAECLKGYCVQTAIILARALESRGYSAVVIRGAVREDQRRQSISAEDVPAADEFAHWWVETTIEGQYFVIDLCSLHPDRWAKPLVMADRPPEFIPYEVEPDHDFHVPLHHV